MSSLTSVLAAVRIAERVSHVYPISQASRTWSPCRGWPSGHDHRSRFQNRIAPALLADPRNSHLDSYRFCLILSAARMKAREINIKQVTLRQHGYSYTVWEVYGTQSDGRQVRIRCKDEQTARIRKSEQETAAINAER